MISQACFSLARKHKRKVIKPRENERRQAQIQPRRKGNMLIFAFVFILALSLFHGERSVVMLAFVLAFVHALLKKTGLTCSTKSSDSLNKGV